MQGRLFFQWLLAAGLGAAAFAAHGQQIICQAPQGGQVPCPSPFGDAYEQLFEAERAANERAQREWAEDQINREADYWGAIAVLAPTGEMVHLGFENQPKWAFNPLRKACNMRNGCDVVATYKNTCVALARSSQGQMFFADDAKPQQASALAVQACNQAGGNACAADEKEISCSGYRYVDAVTGEGGIGQKSLRSKLRKFRRDVGALSGSAKIQPAMVAYNPRLRQALLRPKAERAKLRNQDVRDDSAWSKIDLVPPPDLWLAFAFSQTAGKTGLGLERDESSASVQAKLKCEARDCETIMSAHSGQCFAIVQGISPRSTLHAVGAIGTTAAQAQREALSECGAGAQSCMVAIAECVE